MPLACDISRATIAADQRPDDIAGPFAQASFDRIRPVIEEIARRLACR
jgi:hypothetical protein